MPVRIRYPRKFQDRPSCHFCSTSWGWKPSFNMPRHVAPWIKEWAQDVVPLQFFNLLYGFDLSCPWFFWINVLSDKQYQLMEKIPISRQIFPFSKGCKGDLNFFLLRHCEERLMRRVNLIELFFHIEEFDVFFRTFEESQSFRFHNFVIYQFYKS